MNGFLEGILARKRRDVARKRRGRRVNELECGAQEQPVRGFREALAQGGAIIAEIKRKSPTVRAFRPNGGIERLAGIYEANGAAAISIVTDEENFGTSLADVCRVREACRLPVLVKDFIIDGSQVLEARAAGADAVLLIARILDEHVLAHLLRLAERLGMAALVECHDPGDLERAVRSGAGLIGINNRDLDTFCVSLEPTRRLLPRIPQGIVRVSESGIRTVEDIAELRALGVDAFLIGGALLESDDPGERLRTLAGSAAGGGRGAHR
jgi:indole-3-glycerol phosphate synthase